MDLSSGSYGIDACDIGIRQHLILHERMYCVRRLPSVVSAHTSIHASRRLSTSTAKMVVQRITMFKVNEAADIEKMIDQYKVVSETNKKVSLPLRR